MRERVLTLAALAALLWIFLSASAPVYAEEATELPGTGKTVFIDPGHGGIETGAVHVGADGKVDLIERDVNLAIGLKLRALLQAAGFRVAMSRETNASPNTPPIDRNDDGRVSNRDEYQAVVDLANESGADVMVSIHNNGSTDQSIRGTEVWFSPLRPFADKNLLLARLLQANLVASLRSLGYDTIDRGIKDDSVFRVFRGRTYEIFVLGQADDTRFHPRAANMPAALGESLFLTNDADAAMLAQERTQQAIAQGYYNAIIQYFARLSTGEPLEFPIPASGAPPAGPVSGSTAESESPTEAAPTPTPVTIELRVVPRPMRME